MQVAAKKQAVLGSLTADNLAALDEQAAFPDDWTDGGPGGIAPPRHATVSGAEACAEAAPWQQPLLLRQA